MPLNQEINQNFFHSLPLQKMGLAYDTKLYTMVRFQFWSLGEGGVIASLLLFPGPLWPGVVVVDKVACMG